MASSEEPQTKPSCKLSLKPLTCQNVLFYYVPIQGFISYTSLSINVMNPSLVLRLFPRRDITNILLVNSLLGTGLYLYNRPHLSILPKKKRLSYSVFGALTFSLGSVLIWAIVRSVIPENVPLCTLCGIGSGFTLVKLGRSYVQHVDSLVKK